MINYEINRSSSSQIYKHLEESKNIFIPPLDLTVNLFKYSEKIADYAVRFEAWSYERLVGLIAAYFNDEKSLKGFITNVSVLDSFRGKGIAQNLMKNCIDYARTHSFLVIELEVNHKNFAALSLYKKHSFQITEQTKDIIKMHFHFNKYGTNDEK